VVRRHVRVDHARRGFTRPTAGSSKPTTRTCTSATRTPTTATTICRNT
jgi:hypothetical protein